MCLYKNAYQYTSANLFFIIKQMNTLSTINNPLGGTPWEAGRWARLQGRPRRPAPALTEAAECFWWFASDARGINLFSTSFHKVPFKIMSFSFLKYTFVIVNVHKKALKWVPVLRFCWYLLCRSLEILSRRMDKCFQWELYKWAELASHGHFLD